MKKFIALLMAAVLLCSIAAHPCAEAEDLSGKIGSNCTWRLEGSRLTISGSGGLSGDFVNNEGKYVNNEVEQRTETLVIEDGISNIYQRFFRFDNLSTIIFPDSLTYIGFGAFSGCARLAIVELPKNMQYINSNAFSGCTNLYRVSIISSLRIDSGAFSGCSNLRELTINGDNAKINMIGERAFQDCSALKALPLTEGTHTIEADAFKNCTDLVSVYLPRSLTKIDETAFSGCPNVFISGKANSTAEQFALEQGFPFIPDPGVVIASGTCGDNVFWSLDDCGRVEITGSGPMKNSFNTPFSYSNKNKVISATIASGITTIGASLFNGCENLVKISVPDTITSIGYTAFSGCGKLKNFKIPSGVTDIGFLAFENCYLLKDIELPQGLTRIGEGAFQNCRALETVVVPKNVTTIDASAFAGCTSLIRAEIQGSVTRLTSTFGNCTSLQTVILPQSITFLSNKVFLGCENLTELTALPNVTYIGEAAFYHCSSLSDFVLPAGVTSIGKNAFNGSAIKSEVSFSDKLTEIGESAFDNCAGLVKAVFAGSETKIGSSAFAHCPDLTIYALTGSSAHQYALTENIPFVSTGGDEDKSGMLGPDVAWVMDAFGRVTVSGSGPMEEFSWEGSPLYRNQDVTEIVIGSGVTTVGDHAFLGCSYLTKVTFPDTLTSIGSGAFEECIRLTAFEIPYGVTRIGSSAFDETCYKDYCSPFDLVLPETIEEIDYYAFRGVNLAKIVLPAKLTELGKNVFAECESLAEFQVAAGNTVVTAMDGVLFSKDLATILRYPPAKADTTYQIPDGVTQIDTGAFDSCAKLTKVIVPASVNNVGYGAFDLCVSLKDISFSPADGFDISNRAFAFCYSLERFQIPAGVKRINSSTFMGCLSLSEVIIPESVTQIDTSAFGYCESLRSVTIPASVTFIADDAFYGNYSDPSIRFETIFGVPGSYAEQYAAKHGYQFIAVPDDMAVLQLPSGLKTIGTEAFAGISAQIVKVPNGVTSIGEKAFASCTTLKKIYIPASVTQISETAFAGDSGFTVYCQPGSEALRFAQQYGFDYSTEYE